jgi:hypothetical protein
MFIVTEKAEAQIVPVSLSNTFNLLPQNSLRIKPGKVNLVIGKQLQSKKDKAFLNEIRNIIIENIKPV